jgi:glycosyltransferase involved in cell wall biosynthesis
MRVAQVNDRYSLVGGSEKTLRRSAEGLEQAGHDILIIHGEEISRGERFSCYSPSLSRATLFRASRPRREIMDALASFQPDVVHFRNFDGPTVVGAVSRRYPTVRTVHTPWTYCPCGTKYGAARRLVCETPFGPQCLFICRHLRCHERVDAPDIGVFELARRIMACYAFREVDRRLGGLVVTSRWMKDMLVAAGQEAELIHVVPPPVDLAARPTKIKGRPPEVLGIGRLACGKGFEDLIAALKFLPGTKLVVVGDGPARSFLEAEARRAGLNGRAEFKGWIPYDELAKIYGHARVVALPSLWPEAFGNVGVEALSFGRPVVGYDVGGVGEWLVDGQVGYLAKAGDPVDLAAKLSHLIENPKLAAAMGSAGRAWAAEFSLARHMEKTLGVYDKAIAAFKNKRRP